MYIIKLFYASDRGTPAMDFINKQGSFTLDNGVYAKHFQSPAFIVQGWRKSYDSCC
jgi:hypothetical protein